MSRREEKITMHKHIYAVLKSKGETGEQLKLETSSSLIEQTTRALFVGISISVKSFAKLELSCLI